MNKGVVISAVLLLLVWVTGVTAAEGWLNDFEAAKKLAAEKNLPILADFSGSDWCTWCKRLDGEVFTQKAFKDAVKERYVLFVADFPQTVAQTEELKQQNQGLAKKYKIRGFPTVLLLDAKGEVIARTGYRQGGPEKYVEHLDSLLSGK